jgi:hypothetical protein
VSASTGKSSYTCDSCKRRTGDATNEHSFYKSNQNEALSTETECTAPSIGDKDSLSVRLEAVRLNDICTMELVKSLIIIVSELSSEVQQLRNDNEAMKIHIMRPLLCHQYGERLLHLPQQIMLRQNHIGMLCP